MRHDYGTHRRCCFLPSSMVLVFSVVVLAALLAPASAQTLGAPFPGLLPPPGVSTAPSVYSALLDFQAGWVNGENPYGVWSYGGSWGLTGSLVLFQQHWTDSDYEMLQQWAEPSVFGEGSADAGVPQVSRNWKGDIDDGNISTAAGRLALHPGVNYAYAHIVFTAPAGGLYSVVATFYAQQWGIDTDVHVLVRGRAHFSKTITNMGESQSFAQLLFLRAGETVDFAVGPNGNPELHPGHTGLEAVVARIWP